jgi:hypothetical protein
MSMSSPEQPPIDHLYASVLREFRHEERLPVDRPEEPALPIMFQTFEELYGSRHEIQNGKFVLTRDPYTQRFYQGMQDVYRRVQIDGQDVFDSILQRVLSERPITLGETPVPYDLPPATLHRILWYRDDVGLEQRARYLSSLFQEEGVGERDFVLMKNPVFRRSVPKFGHTHVFIRYKDSYNRLKPRLDY